MGLLVPPWLSFWITHVGSTGGIQENICMDLHMPVLVVVSHNCPCRHEIGDNLQGCPSEQLNVYFVGLGSEGSRPPLQASPVQPSRCLMSCCLLHTLAFAVGGSISPPPQKERSLSSGDAEGRAFADRKSAAKQSCFPQRGKTVAGACRRGEGRDVTEQPCCFVLLGGELAS